MKRGALLWVLGIGGGLVAMCCLLSFVFVGFGAILGADDSIGGIATATASSGGFEFTPPASFTPVGAPVSPEGTRLLYLLPKPHWTLEPSSALSNGELYAPK
jgi:hypothetical protein